MDDLIQSEMDFSSFNQKLSCININSHTIFSSKNSTSISVNFDSIGMCLEFPKYKATSQTYRLLLNKSDVTEVFVYCDEYSCSFISIMTSAKLVEEIEQNLKTFKIKSPYYNPDIECAKQLKISFLLQNASEAILRFLLNVYGEDKVKIIQKKDAYNLLKSSSTKNKKTPQPSISRSLVYPSVSGIQVKTEDIAQLAHGKPLNDTIIEFYLKYVFLEKIHPDQQMKTHIFGTFFYECLQRALRKTTDNGTDLKTFERVYTWTKNVDIFSKDFIFIPINKRQHWYLAVICFISKLCKEPVGEIVVDEDGSEVNTDETAPIEDAVLTTNPGENAAIEEIHAESSSKISSELSNSDIKSNFRKTRKQIEIIQVDRNKPCKSCRPSICFFDSSDDSTRLSKEKREVADTLKDFLKILWENRNPEKLCQWDKLLFLKAQCPQQRNKYDCGIFLLQYVESFFETPISCFQEPLPDLRNWFSPLSVKTKRTKIKTLISELKKKQAEQPISPENQEKSDNLKNGGECVSPSLEKSVLILESNHCIDHMEIVD